MTTEHTKNTPWLAIGVVIALLIVAANLAGYLYYTSSKTVEIATPEKVAEEPALSPTRSLAEDQREKGAVALRAGNYAKAIASFKAAIKLDPKIADAKTLLDVAQQLAASEAAADAPTPKKREPVARAEPARVVERAPPPPPPVRSRRVRRTPKRRKRVVPREEPEVVQEDGVLVVKTTPAGLDVSVDNRAPERSPVNLSLEPGAYTIRIRNGSDVLEERRVVVEAGADALIEEDYSTRIAELSPGAETPQPSISDEKKLDLVALIDRDAPKEKPPERTEATGPSGINLTPTPGGATPRLVVFWPGRASAGLQRSMVADMSGVDVRVVSRTGDFRRALSNPTDAVMASPYVLRKNGLSPQLSAKSSKSDRYLAVALKSVPARSTMASKTIGVVDELGRQQMPAFVKQLIGSSRTPTLRRVTKVEDLLSLLQFSVAQTVLVKERDFPILESRTQQKLYTLPISKKASPLAVAFASGGRRTTVERAVRGLGNRVNESLGVESWIAK